MFTVKINTGNAAFVEEGTGHPMAAPEVARILRSLADKVERHPGQLSGCETDFAAFDFNGNCVGYATYTPDLEG